MKKTLKAVNYLGRKHTTIGGLNLENWRNIKTAEALYHAGTPEYKNFIQHCKENYTLTVCELCALNGWKVEDNFNKIDKEWWLE